MRALEVSAPWGFDALKVVDEPDPTPGHGEVLVRMKAVSLNYRDMLMVNGMYSRGSSTAGGTITPFSDGCGVVEAVGPGVTRVAVGDRVATLFFQNWTAGRPTLEVHLFDWNTECYDAHLRVNFLKKQRDEERYDSLDALTAQIARDAEEARAYFVQNPL